MPGRHNGIAVARLMQRHNPLLPVIFMSGRSDIFNALAPLANEAIMAKPFLPSELVRMARRLLG